MTSRNMELGVTVEDLSDEEIAALKARGYGRFHRLVRTKPGGAIFPYDYRRLSHSYYNFQFRSDDIVVMAFPRSGSTWTREIVWAMTHLDHLHLADNHHVNTRVFPVHYDMFFSSGELDLSHYGVTSYEKTKAEIKTIMQRAAAHGSRRIISAMMHFRHFQPNLLDTCKVVYVARNPKDVCLSCYNMYTIMGRYTGDLSTWVELFTEGDVMYGPYWKHLNQAWLRRNHPNLHIMYFEDMKTDYMNELRKLNDFLELGLTAEQLVKVMEHTQFDNMKARDKKPILKVKKGSSFFQTGQVGGWSKAASPELDEYMDTWIAQNALALDVPDRYSPHRQ